MISHMVKMSTIKNTMLRWKLEYIGGLELDLTLDFTLSNEKHMTQFRWVQCKVDSQKKKKKRFPQHSSLFCVLVIDSFRFKNSVDSGIYLGVRKAGLAVLQ